MFELELKFIIFFANVVLLAVPISIFEILIEKDKGWSSGVPENKWYRSTVGRNNYFVKLITSIAGVPYFSAYHVLMFFLFLPLVVLIENLFIFHNLLLAISIYFGILVFEDFFWFIFNWYFPALQELLKGPEGNIWWHTRWIKIFGRYYLPKSYLSIIGVVVLLLIS